MDVKVTKYKRVDLIHLSGRVDSDSVRAFDDTIRQLNADGRYCLVVDMAGVDYLSSSGVRGLVGAKRTAKGKGGDVRLAQPSARVSEVLKLAGLTELFDSYSDVTAAVGSY